MKFQGKNSGAPFPDKHEGLKEKEEERTNDQSRMRRVDKNERGNLCLENYSSLLPYEVLSRGNIHPGNDER